MGVAAVHVWDTVVSLHLLGDDGAAEREITSFLQHVDDVFSTFRPDSVISRWYAGGPSSPELESVLALADEVEAMTYGFFDPSWSGRQDPTGIVKGWAVDRAVEIAQRHGITDLQVNAGGDVRTTGAPEGKTAWRLGIADPFGSGGLADVVEGNDLCLATSGLEHRGQHIVVKSESTVVSASVLGPDLAWADGFATALVAAGPEAHHLAHTLDAKGWPSLLIDRDGVSRPSRAWPSAR